MKEADKTTMELQAGFNKDDWPYFNEITVYRLAIHRILPKLK